MLFSIPYLRVFNLYIFTTQITFYSLHFYLLSYHEFSILQKFPPYSPFPFSSPPLKVINGNCLTHILHNFLQVHTYTSTDTYVGRQKRSLFLQKWKHITYKYALF